MGKQKAKAATGEGSLKAALCAVCGIAIMGGAAAAWHYFKIDGFLAFLIAGAGLTLVGKAFNVEL